MTRYSNHFIKQISIFLFLFLLPTQFGKHFFVNFSFINGVKIDYLSPALYITDIVALILIFFYRHAVVQKIRRHHFLFVFIILALILHALNFLYPILALYHVIKIIELILVFLIAKEIVHPRLIMIAFLSGGIMELGLSIMQLYLHSSLQGIFYFFGERYIDVSHPSIATASLFGKVFLRPYGTFSHPNSLAGFYLLLYFYLLIHQQFRRSFMLYTASSFIYTALIFISFSKSAILIYIVLNILYLLRYMKITCTLCLIVRIITLTALSIIFLSSKTDPQSFEKRMALFINGSEIFKNHLLWGVGLGHYIIYQARFNSLYRYFFLQPVHNIFILFFAQTGFIMGTFLIGMLGKTFITQWRKQSFLFCFLVIVFTGMLDHYWLTLQQNWLLLGVIFGFLSRD